MTGPGASGASRLRIAGVALLGVAAIAAVVGLISLGGQGTSSAPAASPPPASAPAPGGAPAPGTEGQPGQPGEPGVGQPGQPGQPGAGQPGQPGAGQPGLPGGPVPPGQPTPGAAPPVVGALPPVAAAPPIVPGGGSGSGSGSGGGGGASYGGVPVRVYNNSTIQGLADTAAGQIRGRGFDVVETGNYAQGVIPVSTVYYRPGSGEQGAAEALASSFGIRAEPRFPGIQGASPGVIVIATNNWSQTAAKGG